ncbi:MAG TPA: DUF4838 domain-containing protein [Chthoniobacteraceae bacterium]|nr:DUF4838 domain-containing protein [Chthoniobacteraceae bacterium]
MPSRPAAMLALGAIATTLISTPVLGLDLVKNGEARAALIIPDQAPPHVRQAVDDFAAVIKASTMVTIPIHTESDAPASDAVHKLYIGDTRHAEKQHLRSRNLKEEAYHLRIGETEGVIVAHDIIRSRNPDRFEANSLATKWALNALLEKEVGVRWLWPGTLGTYIPRHATVTLSPVEKTARPRFIQRRQRIPKMIDGPGFKIAPLQNRKQRTKVVREAIDWLENHQGGYRGKLLVKGHPFGKWWEKYSKDHPDYFAELPPPLTQPYQGSPGKVKLRLANPAVIEQIAREYIAAGAPDVWKLSPNDAGGFDTSEETRAWDIPRDQPVEAIVYSEANLTARYIMFWNLVYERLSRINPEVTLNSLAYASYRYAPPKERPLKARMILSMVPSYSEYDLWKAWADTGSQLILRPNWWCGGGGAPSIPFGAIADYFRFCARNRLVGFDFDSIMGYWSTQGFSYYLIARLGTDPDRTTEEIVREYASAFGAASPKIIEYLNYWEAFSNRAGYPVYVSSGGGPTEGGLFQKIVQEKAISDNAWVGSLQVMPYLYTDEVIAKGEAILNEGEALLPARGAEEARARIAFLKSGLTHLKLLRDTMEAGLAINAAETPDDGLKAEFEKRSNELYRWRKAMGGNHAVWVEWAYLFERSARQPTLTENLKQETPDWRGQ